MLGSEVLFSPTLCAVYQMGFGSNPTKANDPTYFTVPTCVLQVIALSCHASLLYSRTIPIVANSKRLKNVIKATVASFTVLGVVCSCSAFLLLLKTERSNGLRNNVRESVYDTIVMFSAMFCGASLCAIDLISTVCFLKYVKRTESGLGTQSHASSMTATILIANFGAVICLSSLLGSTLYASSLLFTDFVSIDTVYTLMSLTMDAIAIMWIVMKVRLDNLNTLNEKTPTPIASCLSSPPCTTLTTLTAQPRVFIQIGKPKFKPHKPPLS
jgi:hypothetical protein